jgi:alkylhydroperoxidase family enzyme
MRLSKPRVAPIRDEELDDEGREFLQTVSRDGRVLNIYRTLVAHPKLLKRWGVFGTHVLYKSTLPARERELLILRTGWLCRSEYEWGQHVVIARASGVTDEDIERVKAGPEAEGWAPFHAALLRAADELHNDAFIGDATWGALSERFDTRQLIDVIFAVGQYHVVSMALNTLGVQLDEGVSGFGGRK